MDDPKRTIVIASGPHHRTLLALEAVASSVEPLLGDGKYHRNPSTSNLGEGETNDAFYEEISRLDAAEYAEVERRFMIVNPREFAKVVEPREYDIQIDGETVAKYRPDLPEGNRKERRAAAARRRDKRWRIKL